MKNKACSEYNTTESFNQLGSPGSAKQPDNPCLQNQDKIAHNLQPGTEADSNIIYLVGVFCVVIAYIIFKNAGQGGVTLSLRNTFKNILNTASIDLILVCLIVTLSITYIISAKIEGYYEGIYEYNAKNSFMDTELIKVIGETEPIETPYGMPGDKVNLSEINKILHKITMLGYCTFGMIIIAVIFKHYPIKQNNSPGGMGPVSKVRSVMGLLAATFGVLGFYVFANCFANLDQLNIIAQKTPKVEVECGGRQYYLPTIKEHLYPPLRMIYNLWAIAIVMIVIATGSAFATLFVNLSKKAHSMITIESNLITELSQEGRLIAYELNDPLFKLIDSAIAKKVKQKQAAPTIIQQENSNGTYTPKVMSPNPKSAVLPRISTDIPLKLFDFVKFKKYKAFTDDKGNVRAKTSGPRETELFVIIAVNDWTIINTPNNVPGRIYFNIEHNKTNRKTIEDLPKEETSAREITGGIERPKYDGSVIRMEHDTVFARSQEEIDAMDPVEANRLPNYLDSRLAKEAIFGNHDYMNTPDFIHRQGFDNSIDKENTGSIKEDSKVLLLPIDKRRFNLTQMKKAHSNFEELLADVSSAIRAVSRSSVPYSDDEINAKLVNNRTLRTLFDIIQDSITNIFINKASDHSLIYATPRDLALAHRVKENINLFDLTALDLIHIRYSLIENIVFKYFTDNKSSDQSELQMIYKDRRDKFPTTENLIREILPSLKNYVDDKDRAEFENFRTQRGMLAHGTTDMELSQFAERFNKLLNIEPNTYRAHDKITGITKQGTTQFNEDKRPYLYDTRSSPHRRPPSHFPELSAKSASPSHSEPETPLEDTRIRRRSSSGAARAVPYF